VTKRPNAYEPMKATLGDRPFSDDGWVYEPKLDGVRALASRDGKAVTLTSRSGRPLERTYPELVDAVAADPCRDFVADGEIVAFEGGLTSFSRLQGRMGLTDPDAARRTGIAVHLYLFDLLWLHGHDTTELQLHRRKRLLRGALVFDGPIHFVTHRDERGEELFEEACAKGMEGLIAKRADSLYRPGRSRDWLKLKCSQQQELVIGGFTASKGARREFGALLVGYYEGGTLCYAGKVGSGFDHATLERLGDRLRELEVDGSPFASVRPVPPDSHWVAPELVVEVAFGEWTRDGRLRHPRFLGLRDDRAAADVVRERPA